MIVKIKKVHPHAELPTYAKDGDAAMDLHAAEVIKDEYGNYVYLTGIALETLVNHDLIHTDQEYTCSYIEMYSSRYSSHAVRRHRSRSDYRAVP